MDEILRPLGLTVVPYACLRNFDIEPGVTSSELARRSFASRQSMNALFQMLEKAGLLARSEESGQWREKASHLTNAAEELLAEAEAGIQKVVMRMTSELDTRQCSELFALLDACGTALVEE